MYYKMKKGDFLSRQVNTISKSFLFQHIFYENPISLLRVGHKHMGDRSDDLPVLQDRRPGQSLDNTSGPVDQVLVCHTETDAFVGLGGIEIYLVDLDVVRGKFPVQLHENLRRAAFNLLFTELSPPSI